MTLRPLDFESSASAYSATLASDTDLHLIQHRTQKCNGQTPMPTSPVCSTACIILQLPQGLLPAVARAALREGEPFA